MKRKDGLKNNPGQGRKRSAERVFKDAIQKYIDKFPEITEELLNKAMPQSISFKCKKCKTVNVIERVPGTGDKECLIHVNERVLGKVPNKLEMLDRSKQLSSSDLAKLYLEVKAFESEMYNVDIKSIEAELKALPNPETSNVDNNKIIDVVNDSSSAYVQNSSDNGTYANFQSQNKETPVINNLNSFEKGEKENQAQAGGETRKAMNPNSQGGSPTEYVENPKSDSSDMTKEDNEESGKEEKAEHWTHIEPEEDDMEVLKKKLDAMMPVGDDSAEVPVSNFG